MTTINLTDEDIRAIHSAIELLDMSGVTERDDDTGHEAHQTIMTLIRLSELIDKAAAK